MDEIAPARPVCAGRDGAGRSTAGQDPHPTSTNIALEPLEPLVGTRMACAIGTSN